MKKFLNWFKKYVEDLPGERSLNCVIDSYVHTDKRKGLRVVLGGKEPDSNHASYYSWMKKKAIELGYETIPIKEKGILGFFLLRKATQPS